MSDQANPLRQLVLAGAADLGARRALRPRIVLVCGGRTGVGATTIALNLAVALAQRGVRTVLIDADARGGDTAAMCRLDHARSLADVLAGRSTVAESLQPGPGGIQVLAGIWALERISDYPATACDPVIEQIGCLPHVADWVLIDAGRGANETTLRMWQGADLVLLVTTADTDAVMDTYAAIKTLHARRPSAGMATLVNAVDRSDGGDEVHGRLARACRRFLGVEPSSIGSVESAAEVRRSITLGDPFVLAMPTCTAARQVHRAARNLFSLPIVHQRAG